MTVGIMCATGLSASAQSSASQAAPCSAPEYRTFDFWVGHWSVATARKPAVIVAHSVIERLYAGCAIRENWMPRRAGGAGGSLSSYVKSKKGWRQTWVDASGAYVDFVGGWNGQAMVLTGLWPSPGHDHQLIRMTYTKNARGVVRQLGVSSDDNGKTWQPSFDFLYSPA